MQTKSANNVKVIDVSHYQKSIDWKSAKADGVQGAFIKATEGGSRVDLKFAANATAAPAADVLVGYYHYAHPELNAPETEAAHFYRTVKGFRADFPHVLDVEGEASKLGAAALTAWCAKWLEEVEKLTGHKAMIYTGASFARTYLGPSLGVYPLWVAHYGVDKPMSNNTWPVWAVFQYTSSGRVDGIAGNADVNAMERAFFDRYSGIPPLPQPTGEDTIKIVVNDKLAAYGRIVGGRAYLPLRQLGEALDANVHWDATTSTPYVNGHVVTNFHRLGGKTYISVRQAAELLGGKVGWDNGTKKVYFYH